MNKRRGAITAWLVLVPVLVYHFVFGLLPILGNLYISLTKWDGFGSPQWVGLANYNVFFTEKYRLIWFNTLLFSLSILAVQTTLAFFIALMLNKKVVGQGVFRTLWYVPGLTSGAITASVMIAFLAPTEGVLTLIAKAIGATPIVWIWHGNWMRFWIVVFSIWRGVGGPMVLFLAALQGIHRELYEAAMIDGASGWRLTRHITFPLMRPMVVFVLITGMIGSFQMFDTIKVLTNGSPDNMTNVVMLQIYNDAWGNGKLGLAAAGAVVLTLVLLVFSLTQMRMMSRAGDVESA